jgi:probable rRNA maturation factor
MTSPEMTVSEEETEAEGEPPSTGTNSLRSCAEIMAGDDRWASLTGFEELIPQLVAAALAEAGFAPETRSVSVALLSGAEVRSLNKAFRGQDAPTNVLSFPAASAPRGAPDPHFLGDVALSYETVVEEAAAQNKTPLSHAAHLVVHGVLHLAGLDHGSDADAERMEGTERAILAKYGIADPYAEEACGAAAQI